METKSLAFGIVGFLLGGFIVSVAATQLKETDSAANDAMTMSQMTDDLKNKTGDDFDKAFIANMIEHHQGAIDMAKLAETKAGHDEIKKLSNDIISAQEKEIAEMRQWQDMWGYSTSGSDHISH